MAENSNRSVEVGGDAHGAIIVTGDANVVQILREKPRDITKAPYKFLSYYDIGDRDIFFGRDAVVEELAGQIPRQKVVILNGQSGSGKTSLINAGLIPRLAEHGYQYLLFRDYSDPLRQLRDYLRESKNFAIADVGQMSLLQIMRAIRDQQECSVVVIFDQFERFFVGVRPETRRAFLEELKQCLDAELTADELNLVFSLRQDFFGQLVSEIEAFIPTFLRESHHHNLRTLNRDEARQAILGPLKDIADVSFDISFVDEVLLPHLMREAGDEAQIEPPHLQIVCNQLYAEARSRNARQIKDGQPALIAADLYDDLGKAEGMLRDYLDDVVNRIAGGNEKQISVVRSTLKLMIETVGTRKFVSLDAICGDLPDVPQDETVRLIERLQEARVIEAHVSGDDRTYSLSHEIMVAKVESWFDVREMLRRRAQETLQRGLAEWNNTNALLNETQVESVRKWLPDKLLENAERLLQQSEQAIEQQKHRAADQQQRLELARKRIKTARRIAIVVSAILIPASVGFGIWATTNAYRADREAEIARRKEEEANDEKIKAEKNLAQSQIQRGLNEIEKGNYSRGVSYFFAGYDTGHTGEYEPFPSSARNLIAGWSTHLGTPLLHDDPVLAVAFSPDGKTVLTGSFDSTARLWDENTGAPRGEPMMHEGYVRAVAFSPDGKTILTGSGSFDVESYSGEARFWDAETGAPLCEPMRHENRVWAVAFSPDGKTILTGSGRSNDQDPGVGEVRLWDAETGMPHGQPMSHERRVNASTFSPDGKTVLTGSEDKTARLWDAETGEPRGEPMMHEGGVNQVAFSADGKSVLTGSKDKTARLWDAETCEPRGEPMMHEGGVNQVAFSADGKTVLTGSEDKTARLWDAETGEPRGSPMQLQYPVLAVAFSLDGKTVFIGGGVDEFENSIGEARLWNAETGTPRGEPMKHRGIVEAVAFSPDGRTVLTGSSDGIARLWDVQSGARRGEPMMHEGRVAAVAFSPDGTSVLTGSGARYRGGTARLWDAETGRSQGGPMQHEHPVWDVAFSPDGTRVITGSGERYRGGTARLWDAATGMQHGVPMQHEHPVLSAIFSLNGNSVLTGSGERYLGGTARIWDAETAVPRGEPMKHENPVAALAFRPDGKTVVTGSYDGTVRLWDVSLPALDDHDRLKLSVEVRTGLFFDKQGSLQKLTQADWLDRKKQLKALGGPCDIVR